ncbi:MAG: D-alanyl-D-alanine carboxypeptidase family protein, partial [Oscillospiraceae bacterium]|nr:D-alanyl-D-alanine carboxypeptidase family protein [Oscillospiraceae bacterium]
MKTKRKIIVPILICLAILVSVAGGIWYWYDNNVDRSGWKEKDGIRYYQDFHADPVTGWLDIDGQRYYFAPGGIPQTGWQTIDETTYYFEDSGAMVTGWLELNGRTHYFGGNGTLVEGWLWLEDRYYFLDGVMVTGWQTIDGVYCHFSDEGKLSLGFTQIDGNTYHFNSDGGMCTGITWIDEKCYNFQDNGIMFTGWEESEAGTRYYQDDGALAIGWVEVDGKRCYFNEDGYQQHAGWLYVDEYRYYIHEDGTLAVGPTVIDGQTHYFTPKGIEVILVNAMNPVPSFYNKNLVPLFDNFQIDAICRDALLQMLADCEAAGFTYTFNSSYRTQDEQTTILEYRTVEHMRDFGLSFADARAMALQTVAIPGTSEHQMGLAVDILGAEAIAWLTEHCWEYGFIVRYTAEKEPITGITDEPWHFRYVGREVSMDMKDSGLCLEEYLGAPAVTPDGIAAVHGDRWYREEFTMLSQD